MQGSLWKQTELPAFPKLQGEEHCDVLVIGGGLCGVLCAYYLQKAGKDRLWLQRVLQEKDATLRDTWLLTVDGGDKVVLYRKEM